MALFGRQRMEEGSEDSQVKQAIPTEPAFTPPSPPQKREQQAVNQTSQVPTPKRNDGSVTTIGKGITIKGELVGDEDVKIEGRVIGKILLERNLIVGQAGVVEADVQAENINIGGKVTGNLVAQNRVEIVASGTMMGDIKAPKVIVAEGAHFKGNVDMDTSRRSSKD